MQLTATKIRLLSPSPTNCIIQLDLSDDSTKTFIGSGEYCWANTDNTDLLDNKLPHSYKIDDQLVYAMFDINRTALGVDTAWTQLTSSERPDYLLLPKYKEQNTSAINGINTNKNAFLGVISGTDTFAHREYQSNSKYLNYITSPEAITLYNKLVDSETISTTLRLKNEILLDNDSPKFTELFTIQTFNPAANTLNTDITSKNWQSNCNNFDDGVLSATSFITPKQTLNAEYSTQKANDVTASAYQYSRYYNINIANGYITGIYSTGNTIVLNYAEGNSIVSTNSSISSPILISSDYNEDIKLIGTDISASTASAYQISVISTLTDNRFSMYQPEILQSADDSFGGSGANFANSDFITEQHAIHKSTLYSVDLTENSNFSNNIDKIITTVVSEQLQLTDNEFKSKLQANINQRLQALVKTITPAHTQLFNVTI